MNFQHPLTYATYVPLLLLMLMLFFGGDGGAAAATIFPVL
jgi:hypothetical protein